MISPLPTTKRYQDAPPLARVAEAGAPYPSRTPRDATETLEAAGRPIRVLLYGPQEISAAPAAYGERLARLCRAAARLSARPRTLGQARHAGWKRPARNRADLSAWASVPFMLDDKLLKLLGVGAQGQT